MPDIVNTYPGERLGFPQSGPGSAARVGRRIAALVIDWTLATVISVAFFGYNQFALPEEAGATQFAPLLVFAVLQILFIPTIGGSPGHRLVGLRIIFLSGGWVGFWRPIVRTLLLCLVLPALVFDPDQRGLHDKFVNTMLVRI